VRGYKSAYALRVVFLIVLGVQCNALKSAPLSVSDMSATVSFRMFGRIFSSVRLFSVYQCQEIRSAACNSFIFFCLQKCAKHSVATVSTEDWKISYSLSGLIQIGWRGRSRKRMQCHRYSCVAWPSAELQ
jgi:hypothetical protein